MLPLDGVVLAYGVHLPQLALDMEPVRHHLLLQSPSSTFRPCSSLTMVVVSVSRVTWDWEVQLVFILGVSHPPGS